MQPSNVSDESPAPPTGPERKRRRKVLSCIECRRRKVQCDRTLPACTRCEKAGKADSCSYDEYPEDNLCASTVPIRQQNGHAASSVASVEGTITISKDVWSDMFDRLLQQERKIASLEAVQGASTGNRATIQILKPESGAISAVNGEQREPTGRETMVFKGRSFKTQFYGATDPASSIAHIFDLVQFARTAISQASSFHRIRSAMEGLKERNKQLQKTGAPIVGSLEEMLRFVPERTATDPLVDLYIEQYESTYRILHIPSFRKDYEMFWQKPVANRPHFVAIVALIIACVQCLGPEPRQTYISNSSAARERASKIVNICETWLEGQSHKHVTMETYQIRCLLMVAKMTNSIKSKRIWNETCILLTWAMSHGLHRDPALLAKGTSAFDQEMRRRIWATIVELNMQASIDRGMPLLVPITVADCGTPSNLDDEEFDKLTAVLPPSRPVEEFTRSSHLHLSAQSLQLRTDVLNILNEPRRLVPYSTVLDLAYELDNQISSLPMWSKHLNGRHNHRLSESTEQIAVALLHIQLQQFLLTLHTTAFRQASTSTILTMSRAAFFSSARSLLHTLTHLASFGNLMPILLQNTALRISLLTCYVAQTSCDSSNDTAASRMETLWTLFDIVELKMRRLGLLHPTILYGFALYDLLRSRGDLSESGEEEGMPKSNPGIERMVRICNAILDNQDPEFLAQIRTEGSVREAGTGIAADATGKLSGGENPQPDAGFPNFSDAMPLVVSGTDHALGMFEFTGSSEWMFDDWMFNGSLFPD